MARPSGSRSLGAIVAGLKRCKPASLVAVALDGEETPVALTGQRGRYERAARSLVSLEAVQVRCMDADGAVAEVIAIGDSADDGDAPTGKGRDVPGEVERLMKITLDALDKARGRDLDMMAEVVGAAVSVLKTVADRFEKVDAQLALNQRKRERELDERSESLAQLVAETAAAGTADDDAAATTEGNEALKQLLDAVKESKLTTNKKKAEEAKA